LHQSFNFPARRARTRSAGTKPDKAGSKPHQSSEEAAANPAEAAGIDDLSTGERLRPKALILAAAPAWHAGAVTDYFFHILFVDGLFRGKVREDDGYQ